MAPYPRHSSIDYALRSKRPVNRTVPLLHHGFGADKKVLPIFLVFHPLAARLNTLRDSRNRKQEATVLQPEPKARSAPNASSDT